MTTYTPPPDTPTFEEGPRTYAWSESYLASGIGVGITLGGGVSGFTNKAMRDTVSSDVSGLWDFRLALGTHTPLGIELGYIGSAGNLKTFTGASNGTLIGTTAEAALRLNLAPHELFNPYVFAGAGWQRYDVRNMAFATADTGLQNSDNILEVPMGVGMSYRDPSGFIVDLRGTFRWVPQDSSLVTEQDGSLAKLHTWEASGSLGWEF